MKIMIEDSSSIHRLDKMLCMLWDRLGPSAKGVERKMSIFRISKISAALFIFSLAPVVVFSGCASLHVENAENHTAVATASPGAANPSNPSPSVRMDQPADATIAKPPVEKLPVAAIPPSPPVKSAPVVSAQEASRVASEKRVPSSNYDIGVYSLEGEEDDGKRNSASAQDETEKDIMEEALVLLDESQKRWAKGELDDALQLLDQAYALLLDTNGNPAIARQKDDLRLIISKRILAIYNSLPSAAKGKRGEIPLVSNADVEKEIRSFQNYEREFFISSYYRSLIYRPIISAELKKEGMPDELSWLPLVESGFKITALSPARALGLWQFIPSTGYKYGLNRDEWVDERMDIEKSTRAAIAYLKDMHAMFGDWLTVLAGYNCGEGRVMRTIASQQINYLDRFWDLYQKLPNETARYVPRFIATLLIVKDPAKYGFDFSGESAKYDVSSYDVVETDKSMRIHDIAAKLDISEENLTILNGELRRRITPGKTYKLKVPAGSGEKFMQLAAEIPCASIPRTTSRTVKGVFIKHKVRKGETLASIADKYKTSVKSIRSANNISKKGLLAGQRLNIPITRTQVALSSDDSKSDKKTVVHKVKKGDTLAGISVRYSVSVADLKKINNLKGDMLKIGQMIRLSPKEGKSGRETASTEEGKAAAIYKVKKGDSLAKIAKQKGVSLQRLLTLNEMEKKDNIYPGQEIRVQ